MPEWVRQRISGRASRPKIVQSTAGLYTMFWIPALWGGSLEDPLALVVGGHAVGFEIFAILAAPLIFLPTHSGLKIPKWFFYSFYPAHLFVIFLVRTAMGI